MKLALHNLDKLLQHGKGKDISLAIHLAQFQDDDGLVCGVHYGSVADALGMSYSSFYKSLNRLEAMGLIEIEWRRDVDNWHYGWWTLRFVDNDFSSKDYTAVPYMNMNHEILHSPKFHTLSRSQKIIILRIIKLMNYHAKRDGISLRIETIVEWTGKSKRSVVRMLYELSRIDGIKEMVSFELDGDNVFIPFGDFGMNFKLNERRPRKEADTKTIHAIKFATRRMRSTSPVTADELHQAVTDICGLMRQHRIMDFRSKATLVMEAIKACGYLSARYVHYLIREGHGRPSVTVSPSMA
ncbi:MAG: helix-turn-helix domain-containing protein [Defluviitaleaceae bacterium]|nr:helix-turn-helix domain-containing protein [Defluviitaleaceae bacterium]